MPKLSYACVALALCALAMPTIGPAAANERAAAETKVAQACGWYIILGCTRGYRDAARILTNLGGPGVGGGAGTSVVDTNQYPNFRNGYFCVADGPYGSRSAAQSVAWNEAVRDAYVKNSC